MDRLGAVLILSLTMGACTLQDSPSGAPIESRDNISASYRLLQVEALARSLDSTSKLITVWSSNVFNNGYAVSWSFRYGSSVPPVTYYYFTATFDSLRFDSMSTRGIVGAAFITHAWINSIPATQFAESNGGTVFRSANPLCWVSASLGEPVVPNPSTYWYFTYQSKTEHDRHLYITIDATTGEIK